MGQVVDRAERLALLPSLNIRENLLMPFWAVRRDVPEAELAASTAELEIADLLDRRPSEVSFGEQQRAAIARAVLGVPRSLAVLDEPTGHQDEVRAALVVDVLLAARTRGTCVLVATHDPDVIAAADDVVTLRSPLAAGVTPGRRSRLTNARRGRCTSRGIRFNARPADVLTRGSR